MQLINLNFRGQSVLGTTSGFATSVSGLAFSSSNIHCWKRKDLILVNVWVLFLYFFIKSQGIVFFKAILGHKHFQEYHPKFFQSRKLILIIKGPIYLGIFFSSLQFLQKNKRKNISISALASKNGKKSTFFTN